MTTRPTTRRTSRLALRALALGAAFALAAPGARAGGFSGEMDVVLRDCLTDGPDAVDLPAGGNLFLHLEAEDGQWKRVWGKGLTISEHPGLVESAEVTDEGVRLKVGMLILGDFWVKGEWPAAYEITLDRRDDGTLAGRYEGHFAGHARSGEAEGDLFGPRPVREGFKPPAMDEHPRVLFRKADIPRLKAKLDTPFGRRYRERAEASGDMISLGVLYQLTGDPAYADRARAVIEAEYRTGGDDEIPVYGFGSGGFGHDIFRTAVAYDLCRDAWPAAFNTWLRTQFEAFTERQQHVLMTSHANYHPCSNYYGPGRGVPGVVSMVLWGDKGPAPPPPRDPVERAWPVRPPPDYAPAAGAEVVDFEAGRTPNRWIWTGLLPYECSRDVLAKLGGYAGARPTVGTTTEYTVKSGTWFKMAALKFAPLPEGAATGDGIDLGKLSSDGAASVSAWFTHVRVGREQVLRPVPGREGVRAWMSGTELEADTLYRVHPGVHPLTVELRAEKTAGVLAPRLVPVDTEAQGGPVGLYRIREALWQEDKALWDRTGMDPTRQLWLDRGWFQNYQHYLWGVGHGGFMAETGGYAQISSWYPSVYASMYPNFFGRPVSPRPDVDHIIPRQMMQAVFVPGRKPAILKLNSALTLNLQWMACHFPIIPDRYKPSALWAWNYLAGVTKKTPVAEVLDDGKRTIWGLGGLSLAQTFLHYPLDMGPVHPSEGMPRHWRADTFGFHVFRSGWGGDDQFVSQVFAKAAPVRGWNHPNAAGFTIYGLGHAWTVAPEGRNGVREQYSVVLLPEDEINQSSCGRIVHHEARPDGSGSLTIDLGDVYAARTRGLYDGMFFRHPERFKPSGIAGLRAFGFDYSGTCGAPALVVIVDRIRGGGRRLWTWQRPGAETVTDERGFTLRYPDATMRATFVSPKAVRIEAPGPQAVQVGDPRHGFHGNVNRVKAVADGASAETGDGESFFVVLTFQPQAPGDGKGRGEAPPVTVEGDGLAATVKVGGQTVRFDGTRVVFGP